MMKTTSEDLDDSDAFFDFAGLLWEAARDASDPTWGQREGETGVSPPERALAATLIDHMKRWSPEEQSRALEHAATTGESVLAHLEKEVDLVKQAVAALRSPRADLLRSRIAAIGPSAPKQ